MKSEPIVSVVLPVFNAQKYLRACIDSILAQTLTNLELIVLNDGSTDSSEEIVLGYKDERIRYVKNEKNLGLIETLNKGLKLATGKYIARMDADDVSLKERFERQVEYLDKNPSYGLLGTWFQQLRLSQKTLKKTLTGSDILKAELLFRSAFAHPSVMVRRSIIVDHDLSYDAVFPHAEDYELWTRIAEVTAVDNLPDALLLYRIHEKQVSRVKSEEKEETRKKIMRRQLSKLIFEFDDNEFDVHYRLSNGTSGDNAFLVRSEKWLMKVFTANTQLHMYDENALRQVLVGYWMKACENSGQGRKVFKMFRSSDLMRSHEPGIKAYLKLAAKLLTGYKQLG